MFTCFCKIDRTAVGAYYALLSCCIVFHFTVHALTYVTSKLCYNNKLQAGARHDMPHPCMHHTLRSSSNPYLPGLLCPVCLASSSCGCHEYSHCSPAPAHTCLALQPSSSPYMPGLRHPVRLASSSCGAMNIHSVNLGLPLGGLPKFLITAGAVGILVCLNNNLITQR